MYLNWLESMEFIKYDMEDGFKIVKLTTRGIEWYRKNIATRKKPIPMIELD